MKQIIIKKSPTTINIDDITDWSKVYIAVKNKESELYGYFIFKHMSEEVEKVVSIQNSNGSYYPCFGAGRTAKELILNWEQHFDFYLFNTRKEFFKFLAANCKG